MSVRLDPGITRPGRRVVVLLAATQVAGRAAKQFGVVPEHAQAPVAVVAEQTTHSTGIVGVINMQVAPVGTRAPADCADASLLGEHAVIVGQRQAVPLEFLDAVPPAVFLGSAAR